MNPQGTHKQRSPYNPGSRALMPFTRTRPPSARPPHLTHTSTPSRAEAARSFLGAAPAMWTHKRQANPLGAAHSFPIGACRQCAHTIPSTQLEFITLQARTRSPAFVRTFLALSRCGPVSTGEQVLMQQESSSHACDIFTKPPNVRSITLHFRHGSPPFSAPRLSTWNFRLPWGVPSGAQTARVPSSARGPARSSAFGELRPPKLHGSTAAESRESKALCVLSGD